MDLYPGRLFIFRAVGLSREVFQLELDLVPARRQLKWQGTNEGLHSRLSLEG